MFKYVLSATIALFGYSAFAGSANAHLQCQSDKGTVISGDVPGDEAEFTLTVSKNGVSVPLYSQTDQSTGKMVTNATISNVTSLEDGVWTLISNRTVGYGFVQMYAIPKTFKYHRITNGYKASFTANAQYNLSEIRNSTVTAIVSCTLDYSI
jgi:hypothetical protein